MADKEPRIATYQPIRVHSLKTWPEYFEPVLAGVKTFEIRKNDRGFKVGDILALEEYEPGTERYTGRICYRRVLYIFQGGELFINIDRDYVIMSIGAQPWPTTS